MPDIEPTPEPKASTPDERTELARWLADRRGVSFDDCDLGEQAEWRWEAEAVISKLHEHTDTDGELAMANAYAKEGWAWVDDFCEALGDGTTVFNFKERTATTTEAALTEALRERDLAIAHDRQPYPTAWAYEQVCATLDRTKSALTEAEHRAERAEKVVEAARGIVPMQHVLWAHTVESQQAMKALNAALAALDTTAGPEQVTYGNDQVTVTPTDGPGWTE